MVLLWVPNPLRVRNGWSYQCAVSQGNLCYESIANIDCRADGSKTLEQFVAAAAKVNSTVAPSTVQGGVKGSASNGTSAGTSTSTATTSSASASSTGNAGVETRGSVQWGLFAITGLVAAGVGSLIV
jgi:hypothetical protein